jgi:sugar/nucleoside kinase (ribokinase family)/D-lyxose ketol-isomerase
VGILVADLFVPPLPRLPQAGELQLVDEMLLSTGGCAANAAMDLARLDVRVAVSGKVGNDFFAAFVRRELESKGVDVTGIRQSAAAPTSSTVILPVVGQDRRYIHTLGANAELRVEDVSLEQVAGARVLYVGGYLLFPGFEPQALAELFRFARARGVQTVLDVAGPRPGQALPALAPVLPFTDVFLPNQDEAAIITGEGDAGRQAGMLLDLGASTVVITRGAEGVLVRAPHAAFEAAALPIDFVDGSGAGDAFDAGYIVGLLEGWDVVRTVAFASAVGASACRRLGTTPGVFTRAEALDYLSRHPLNIWRPHMLTQEEVNRRQGQSLDLFRQAGLVITPGERQRIEIADFGLGEFEQTGLGVLVYVNTQRVCAKELAMLPRQTCPEHRHPTVAGRLGKEETFRCRWGEVYLYVSGEASQPRRADPPAGRESSYTVWHEVVQKPGDQYTLVPDTLHWFQAGDQGAVVSEFSSTSTDEADVFTDPEIQRITRIVD